jgi:hypothetical protein
MKIAVFGSTSWQNYNDIIRSLTVFIQEVNEVGHKEIIFVHTGKRGAENMITEYVGKVEKMLRHNGFKIKEEWFRDKSNLSDIKIIESGIDYALVFSTGDARAYKAKKVLEAYEIPFRLIEEV